MKHRNYFQKHFNGLKYLLAIIGLMGVFLSCSDDNGSTPQVIDNTKIGSIVSTGVIPDNFDGYDEVTKTIFSNYTAGAKVTARYVKTDSSGDGTSWESATNDLKGAIDSIGDATNNHIYVVLVASGTYQSTNSYSMKNYVAIIGGFTANTYNRAGETQLDGNGARSVFYHNNLGLTNSAILYGLTITNGNTTGDGGGMYNRNSSPTLIEVIFSSNYSFGGGGGVYNESSSPTLIGVTFSGSTANEGGGMYNLDSSPTLIRVTFSANTATSATHDGGGGMYNLNSSPTLDRVTFSGNSAFYDGGGMYNRNSSSPILNGVTFSANTATSNGGGMYNSSSSPTLIGVTFSANTAGSGGGMYNRNSSSPILNGVTFSANMAGSGGGIYHDGDSIPLTLINTLLWGNNHGNIYLKNDNSLLTRTENLNLYYSLVEGGITPSTNATGVRLGNSDTNIYRINIRSSSIITANPNLQGLADNGGEVMTHKILSGSPPENKGAYVRGLKTDNSYSVSNVYYSSDSSTSVQWYRASDQALVNPTSTDDLTATDARGYGRNGRPDIGAYEADGRP